jgi:hypothetical protein
MDASVFAEWLHRQGRHIVKTASSYWFDQGPRVYQAFPYHWIIRPTERELAEFLEERGALGLRYSTDLRSPQGIASYHAVFPGGCYDLHNLDQSARRNVRIGLRNCTVRPLPFTTLATEGWPLQADTLDRQGRRQAMSQPTWSMICLAAEGLPGFEAWGAFVDGCLAASLILFQMCDCCYILYPQSQRQYLGKRVNNALAFTATRAALERPGVRSILYGLHSLDAPPSVDEFKFRMGYTAKPVRQRVVFHPWLRPLANPTTHALVRQAKGLRPGNCVLAKLEGMLRFYLEGRRPLTEQRWPEALSRQKGQIIQTMAW